MNANSNQTSATAKAAKTFKSGDKVFSYTALNYGLEHTVLSVNESARTCKIQYHTGRTQIVAFCDLEAV